MLGHNQTMLVAALDTTTRLGSVAIVRDRAVLAAHVDDDVRPHAETLPGTIVETLASLELTLSDVDIFAVALGPGSFTGLRIGLAAVQGLAFATGRPVVGVSAFDALATAVFSDHPTIRSNPLAIWLDGQRHEVFAAVMEFVPPADDTPMLVRVLDPPSVGTPAAILSRWVGQPWFQGLTFAGDGARIYKAAIVDAGGGTLRRIEVTPALAPSIGRIAEVRAAAGGAVPPHALKPLYVRRPDAELARDRRRTAGM